MELGDREFWARLESDPKQLAAEVCSINVVSLNQTLEQHPALRAWVTAAYEVARIDEERAQWEVTKASARALLKAKEEKDTNTGKAKTGEVLKAEAEVDADVVRLTEELLRAQHKRSALRAMSTALEDRLQMLIQISANQRNENRDYR